MFALKELQSTIYVFAKVENLICPFSTCMEKKMIHLFPLVFLLKITKFIPFFLRDLLGDWIVYRRVLTSDSFEIRWSVELSRGFVCL